MKRYFLYLAVILTASTASRCGDEIIDPPPPRNGTLTLVVEPHLNGQAFGLNKFYQGASYEYSMSIFRAYLSNIRLVREDNTELSIEDVALIDLGTNTTTPGDPNTVGKSFTITIPPGTYKAIDMGLGVHKPLNIVKMDYPNDHALSIYRGTDWSWAGYRFIMLEGIVKNKQSGQNESFDYHTALDTFYREMSAGKAFTIQDGGAQTLKLKIDVDKIFDPADQGSTINLITQDFTHTEESDPGQMELTRRITENMKNAITLE